MAKLQIKSKWVRLIINSFMFFFYLTCVEVRADHLLGVDGVEAGKRAAFCVVTVEQGFIKA